MLRHALAKSGVPFSPHNPAHTHHYAKSTRRRAKTDRLDAAQTSQPAQGPRTGHHRRCKEAPGRPQCHHSRQNSLRMNTIMPFPKP
ncbi:MAG: IS110 family transposase [Mesorhizobium sp.]|nr:MAG: hypothetical protein EOQ76_24410 [Mesorhizobium sp.]RWH36839.1 MAG: hypothetical protein EOQ79_16425 [Mesorhizobium sp.]TIM62303.1 MAG: IS110 family transposase [Mesorhizobium sp.]TIR60001.1 MAG: IS110 family transposase [Mesorhizobium sp.]TIR64403.1 MAG: IS110 family transposase [Mesorhizobium sp.]